MQDVPIGKDEKANTEIKKIGEIPKFNFKVLSHNELGVKHDMMDFEISNKTSGARFVVLKNDLALLERAISNFMLDTHTKDILKYLHHLLLMTIQCLVPDNYQNLKVTNLKLN